MRKSWLVIGISVLTVLAVALVACGGDGGSKKTPTATKAATKVATSAATKVTTATPEATSGAPATSAPTTAGAGPTVKTVTDATMGAILTDGEGRTLYQFANDSAGVSNCNASCDTIWPPLTIAGGSPTGDTGVDATALGTIQRQDGKTQVTYNGKPLYRYSGDTAVGDTKGNGVANLWSVVDAEFG